MPPNIVSTTLRGGLFTRIVGRRMLYFQQRTSTMDEASQQAQGGAAEGLVVVAETQTGGRGRFERSWISAPGNLYLSVLFRPALGQLPLLGVLSGVAVVRAIRKTAGLEARIKWPNDVLLNDRKVAGILVESVVTGAKLDYAIVGIGVNVALDTGQWEEIARFATSLNQAAGQEVSREALLRHLLQDLDALYLRLKQGESPLPEWKTLLATLGQQVQVRWRSETYSGRAEGVDDLGNLLLRGDHGELVTLTAGDVTLHNP